MLVALFILSVCYGQDIPHQRALDRVENARRDIVTAELEWTTLNLERTDERTGKPQYQKIKTRIAGENIAAEMRFARVGGDVAQDTLIDGKQEVFASFKGERYGVWLHQDGAALADHFGEGGATFFANDLRSLGIAPGLPSVSVHEMLWRYRERGGEEAVYKEQEEGGLIIACADFRGDSLKWWIDPRRQWAVVRAAHYHDGQLVTEARSTIEEIDGIWFPRKVELFNVRANGGDRPTEVIEVHHATFNRGEHPRNLTPSDIGIEVGTVVTEYAPGPVAKDRRRWDGEKIVSAEEFSRREASGELVRGPTVQRMLQRVDVTAEGTPGVIQRTGGAAATAEDRQGGSTTSRPATYIDEVVAAWKSYTEQFVTQFQLDGDQRQHALLIFQEAEEDARAYWAIHKGTLEAVLGLVRQLNQKGATSKPDQSRMLAELEKDLTAPFLTIFEKRIGARLRVIPTRAQQKIGGDLQSAPAISPH